ncbi:MAG TPA: STAS domain-containing protein [Acidimicrobiales bacterium]|jgi:anti-sigma B factor antagonist|nr:STAS domain-containing protein [Acidimicrobiales bacterium]
MTIAQPRGRPGSRPNEEHAALSFEISSYENGHDALVEVSGDLDSFTSPRLREVLNTALRDRPNRVFVGLTDVPFVDSTALSVLAECHYRARSQGCELVLCSPTQTVRRVLDLTRLSDRLPVQG